MTIYINEKNIGGFATEQTAIQTVKQLQALGWGVAYSSRCEVWEFDTLADYNRFEKAFEQVLSALAIKAVISFSWGCQCPKGADPALCHCGQGEKIA